MMRRRPLAWFLLSLLLFGGGVILWKMGEERRLQNNERSLPETESVAPSNAASPGTFQLVSQSVSNAVGAISYPDVVFPHRLRNTPAPVKELIRNDSALLLENALIDSSRGTDLAIPEHLRAGAEPGAYIVQASGPITDAFRSMIQTAGGTVISYVPNNAYLVNASAAVASTLSASGLTLSVVPFEPYFKIKGDLLKDAVKQKALPNANVLNLVLFPDTVAETTRELVELGATMVGEDRSPFGPVVAVQVPVDALSAVASLSGVQIVDRAYARELANDLSRERIGVSLTSTNETNYLGLTGKDIVIQLNDSGVDRTHPDLAGRVSGSLIDLNGHGTHVAATIIGNGAVSDTLVTNVNGSSVPAVFGQFRGMASEAELVVNGGIAEGSFGLPDWFLQESAAENDALISNNSWSRNNDGYDIGAASYDAAVRDALPQETGSQAVLFVFSAGNVGFGSSEGQGAVPDTIRSPGTAKNVITVGAIEQQRDITNEVLFCEMIGTNLVCVTNAPPFEDLTDTDWQVADFSSRGNVGIGVEGEFGRFKPDVVAPGTFVVSARSGQWDTNAYYNPTNRERNTIFNELIPPGTIRNYLAFLEENTVEFEIFVSTPAAQPEPLPDLPIYASQTGFPTIGDTPLGFNDVTLPPPPIEPLPGIWYYGIGNPTDEPLFVNVSTIISTTNASPVPTKGLMDLNAELEPYYRYESGTSMSAPAISGALALMQEFFEDRLDTIVSPALLKAFVINGSRSTSPTYDFEVNTLVNNQGWGLFNLPNVVSPTTNYNNGSEGAAIFFYDQSPTNALATGMRHTRLVTLASEAQNQSMRFTLVWTDPPGNPVVGAKLVNNLDLVVTDTDSGEVYYGNDIPAGSDWTQPGTNDVLAPDFVNNVENVFLPAFTGTNFSVAVIGRRVNVNAVYDHPDNTVQDYALVISSGDGTVDTALTVSPTLETSVDAPEVTFIKATLGDMTNINASLLEGQLAGENTPLLGTTNGMTNQWHFYAMTNTSSFTNATFITFLPSTLSIPRMGVFVDDSEDQSRLEGDIDLYVSTDPNLTNLIPAVLEAADKSLGRGGTEAVVLTNAVPGVYYIGVKSEDHEAAHYRFFGAFSRLPINEDDEGDLILRGMPIPSDIPDGSPESPKAALVLAVAAQPIEIRNVIVTNRLIHGNIGDLIGNLSHDLNFAVLNNHTFPDGDNTITDHTYIYDDSQQGDIEGSQTTDGPGSLRSFTGEEGLGVWLLTMVDDSLTHTGRVQEFEIRLERSPPTNEWVSVTLPPRSWYFDVINVPANATNVTVEIEIVGSNPLPVELYMRRGDFPTLGLFDTQTTIYPPGGRASISIYDLPPLVPDRYYFGIYNPNGVAQELNVRVTIELGLDGRDRQTFTSAVNVPLIDNAVTYAEQLVDDDRRIAGVEVGLIIEHPRVSDLVAHLISPTDKRVLLVENRGGTSADGFGGGSVFTNVFPTEIAGDFVGVTNVLDVGATRGTLLMNYTFFEIPDRMRVYYDGTQIYDTGLVGGSNETFSVDFGPGSETLLEITMNEGDNSNTNTAWEYTATVISSTQSYLVLTEDTDKTTTPIKFAVPPLGGVMNSPTGTVVFADGFENGSPGFGLPAGSYIGGWRIASGSVDLLQTGYQGSTAYEGSQYIDLNGSGAGTVETNLTLTPGQSYSMIFAYSRNIGNGGPPNPTAEVWLGTNLLADVIYEGTNSWVDLNWKTTTVQFVAGPTNNQLLQVRSTLNSSFGVMFDDFIITEVLPLDRYYLPEEVLTPLIGDSAEGQWRLELWDNRAGAVAPGPALISWELRFIYETIVQVPILIQPGVPITNTIPAGEILNIAVDVPNWALFATNQLLAASDPVDVLFNQLFPVSSTNGTDVLMLSASTGGSFTLDTVGSSPALVPGARYYIGIENPNAVEVTVSYQVDFDITALTNGVPVMSTLGTNLFGGFLRYFSYDVSTNATAVSFDLFNLDGDVNLVASYETPLPTLVDFDYGSFNSGTNDETITVFTDSTPVALTPGRWFLGVFLADFQPVDYTIQATEFTNDFSAVIRLTNGIPYTNSNAGIPPIEDYYRFTVTNSVQRLQFDILNTTVDITLVASKGLPLPDLDDFDYISDNPGTDPEYILILPDSTPVSASVGEWFLTVINASGGEADYTIRATQWAETGQPILIQTPELMGTNFCFSWNSLEGATYVVQAMETLSDSNWVEHSGTITATSSETTYCVDLPSPFHFFRVIEGVALEDSVAPVTITNIVVAPGGVTFEWKAPADAQCQVEWSDVSPPVWNTDPTIITSTDGNFSYTDDGSTTAPLGPTRFYRVVILPL